MSEATAAVEEPEVVVDDAPVESESTTSVETPEASTSEPSTPAPPSLFDRLKETAGVDYSTKYQSEDDLLKGLANAASLVGKKSDRERQYEQLVSSPQWQQYQQWVAQQQAQPQQFQQRAPEQPQGFQIPQLQEGDDDWIEDDPNNPGQRRISHLAPADVRKRILDRTKFVRAMQTNPHEAFGPVFEHMQTTLRQDAIEHAERVAQQRFQQWQAQQAEQQAVNQIITNRESLIYEKNTNGQRLTDATGMWVLKPWGQAYTERMHYLINKGIQDPRDLDELSAEYANMKTQTKSPPPPAPGQTKAKTVTGGQVKPGEKVSSGSLAQRLMNDNPHIGENDYVSKIVFE